MSPPISYGLLVISLGGIFAAGGSIGYFMGKDSQPAADPAAGLISSNAGASPETWADQAFENLAGDLLAVIFGAGVEGLQGRSRQPPSTNWL